MDISEFTIRLIVLMLPGAIASLIIERLTVHSKWDHFQFIVYSVILGILSYCLYQGGLYLIATYNYLDAVCHKVKANFNPEFISFWSSLFNSQQPISPKEVFIGCIYSIFVGLIISKIIHYKYLNRIAKKLRITDKYGDENLFTFFLNAKEVNWVWIRDKKKGLTYEGLRESFSETDSIREILLRDVKVYTYEDSALCYEIPALYLSFPSGELHIEMPPYNNNQVEGTDGTKRD